MADRTRCNNPWLSLLLLFLKFITYTPVSEGLGRESCEAGVRQDATRADPIRAARRRSQT